MNKRNIIVFPFFGFGFLVIAAESHLVMVLFLTSALREKSVVDNTFSRNLTEIYFNRGKTRNFDH